MTQEQFIYWLQGFLEISNVKTLNETEVQIIRDHLALVLTKQTPDRWNQPTITITPQPANRPYGEPFQPFGPPVYPHLPNQPICSTDSNQTFCSRPDTEIKVDSKRFRDPSKNTKC